MAASGANKRSSLPEIVAVMQHLGLEPGGGVLPRESLRYATALTRCKSCRNKPECREWLDRSQVPILAPAFCLSADILFELQADQLGGNRRGSTEQRYGVRLDQTYRDFSHSHLLAVGARTEER